MTVPVIARPARAFVRTSVRYARLYGPDGTLLWHGPGDQRRAALAHAAGYPAHGALARLCGAGEEGCTRGAVLKAAETLGMVSRDGCVKGFVAVLPSGAFLDRCVEAFNRAHLEALGAVRMEFPLVFDANVPDLAELTRSYEVQDRMYRLGSGDAGLRLAYAADPGFFAWLRGRQLRPERLPWAVFSPTPVFRRIQTGEVGGLDHLRQFAVPDVHVLATADGAGDTYQRCTALAADGSRFWLRDAFAHFIDVAADHDARDPELGRRSARAAGQFTLVNVLEQRPRYYAFRAGMVVDAGFGLVMMYNLQWDDTNAARFGISSRGGEAVVVLHATVLGGWPKLLPVILGRALSGWSPRSLPVEVAAAQIVVLAITDRALPAVGMFVRRLNDAGVRAIAGEEPRRPLGHRLRRLRADWTPYVAVCGDREAAGEEPRIAPLSGGSALTLESFLAQYGARLERCQPSAPFRLGVPF